MTPRCYCKAKTWSEVETEVRAILKKYEGSTGLLTRDKIMVEMGVEIPIRYKHTEADGSFIYIRQAISRTMKIVCNEPGTSWVKTELTQSPSWKWRG